MLERRYQSNDGITCRMGRCDLRNGKTTQESDRPTHIWKLLKEDSCFAHSRPIQVLSEGVDWITEWENSFLIACHLLQKLAWLSIKLAHNEST